MPTFRHSSATNKDQRAQAYWMHMWLTEMHRVAKDGAPICVFTDWRQLPLTSDAVQAAGFITRGILVWDKGNARPQQGRPRNLAEYIVWGSKGNMPTDRKAHNPGRTALHRSIGQRARTSDPEA